MVFGEMVYVDFKANNSVGGIYNINSVYGRGLVNTHLRANEQDWVGTVLDESFISEIAKRNCDFDKILSPCAKRFKVPYNNGVEKADEYVLNIIKGPACAKTIKNLGKGIRCNFAQYNKPVGDKSVQQKISNTLRFLESYSVKEE